jgi:hypothetical protein
VVTAFYPFAKWFENPFEIGFGKSIWKKERKIFVFTPSLTSGLLARFPLGPLGLPLLSTLFLGRPASEATTAAAASPLSPLSR